MTAASSIALPAEPRGGDAAAAGEAYAASREHIEDEFARLELRVERALLRLQEFAAADAAAREAAGRASLAALGARIEQRRAASADAGTPLALVRMAGLFRLDHFETQCLLVAFAAECEARYGNDFAILQGDAHRTLPSAALMIDLLCDSAEERRRARASFGSRAPLFAYRLLQWVEEGAGRASRLARALRVDPRIADELLGGAALDERLEGIAQLARGDLSAAAAAPASGSAERMKAFVRRHLAGGEAARGLVFRLHGPDLAAQRAAVDGVCSGLGLQLVVVDAARAGASPLASELPALVGREAVLLPAAVCITQTDWWMEHDKDLAQREAWFAALRHYSQLTFLVGEAAWLPDALREGLACIEIAFPLPDLAAREGLWHTALQARGLPGGPLAGELASRFRFGAERIAQVLDRAEMAARWRDPEHPCVAPPDIFEASRAHAAPGASPLAVRTTPSRRWDRLVLPADAMRQLRELCDQARHRHLVYGEWGFERRLALGHGLNALFTGAPGTGKTMAADVVAAELQCDLFRVDLSQTVSKYIGETEKNLEQLFREAEASHAVLFFDEADALFGRRSEVRDAHDRYANIETGYLLQRMEQHQGLVILATNLRQNLDEAFCRRMQFVVEFPFPDEAQRARLWSGLFPPEVPRSGEIDFAFLARQFKVPGGNIRNIGVCAAFLAAGEGTGVAMRHLVLAARREYRKLGWPCTANDFGPYHDLLKALDG